MATAIGNYLIEDYFLTGEIPWGQKFPPDERLSDVKLTADCLDACGVSLCVPTPPIVKETLEKASKLLGMDKYDPPLPASGDGFIEYGRRSGILS